MSETGGARPYLSTAEGFTGARGRFEGTERGVGVRSGCGAGGPVADGGVGSVRVGAGAGAGAGAGGVVLGWEENIRAVRDAPAAAEPAAIKARVDLDMLPVDGSEGASVLMQKAGVHQSRELRDSYLTCCTLTHSRGPSKVASGPRVPGSPRVC